MPRDDWHLRHGPTPDGARDPRLVRLADLSEASTDAWLKHRQSPGDSFPNTVTRFLEELSQ
jgi:hypothetical protein